MGTRHDYTLTITWTGNSGAGTRDYRSYERSYVIGGDGKPDIAGSADAAFRGDGARWNPEELLVASLSACHKLWFLHLAADSGIVVTGYVDKPHGSMQTGAGGGGRFTSVTLRPVIELEDPSAAARADALHAAAHDRCFIARSVNFPVTVEATYAPPAPR